jgi:YHS domain-containing protein
MQHGSSNHSVVRDPVCGTVINNDTASTTYRHNGTMFHFYFCSESCRDRFSKKPGRYLRRRRHRKLPPRMSLPISRMKTSYHP